MVDFGNRGQFGNRSQEPKEFKEQVIAIDRVARVVKGGRRFRFRAVAVIGDGRGRVGLGIAKAGDVSSAVDKATKHAKKTLFHVPLQQGTIPHEVTARFAGAVVLLKPAGPGTGVIAGGSVRQIVEAVGISDILSKALGSTNKLNNCYATIAALKQLRPRPERAKSPVKSAQKPKSAAKVKP